tara:strand:+ start:310 stop:1314 length:1005 start_codon:yes stop_codon:yes gene_type:complete
MTFIAVAIGTGAVLTTAGTVYGASQSNKQAKRAGRRAVELAGELEALENKRQPIINPYAGVTDLSSMVEDLSGKISNPFANLGVATQAAEIEIEEADIALANTLDILRATGASAGGATALAQAALQSKKGVSANIEQQEAQNEKLRAQGEANLERLQLAEAQRVQSGLFGEAQRMQDVDVKGQTFVYGEQERRETEQLNRKQAQITGQQQSQVAARQQQASIIGGGISALGGLAGSAAGALGAYNTNQNLYTGGGSGGGGGMPSDRKLKKNIKLISVSPKGLNIYAFEYIDKTFGIGTWQGVMSDEMPQNTVIKHKDGYDTVDYSKLDVKFKQI